MKFNCFHRLSVILFVVVFSLSVLNGKPLFAQKDEASKKVFYVLNVTKAEGILAEVSVNDVLLVTTNEQGYSGFKDLNVWILPGGNTIRVKLSTAKNPQSEPFSKDNDGITLSVSEALAGQMSDEGKPVLEFKWPGDQKPQLPFEKVLTFKVNTPPPSEFWKTAKEITLDDAAKKEILALISELQSAFSQGAYEKIADLLFYRDEEMDKARYQEEKTKEKRKEELVKVHKNIFSQGKIKIKPFTMNDLVYNPAAQKRLVSVKRKDGGSPIFINMGTWNFELPAYVAPVSGKWTFVR